MEIGTRLQDFSEDELKHYGKELECVAYGGEYLETYNIENHHIVTRFCEAIDEMLHRAGSYKRLLEEFANYCDLDEKRSEEFILEIKKYLQSLQTN